MAKKVQKLKNGSFQIKLGIFKKMGVGQFFAKIGKKWVKIVQLWQKMHKHGNNDQHLG